MLATQAFGDELNELGFRFYSGVPCSFLKYLINYAINECDYVMAANEGDAVAVSAGAYLGGKKSVVLMQNSGLTNATSPLTSLNYCFRLPVLGFVSLRGEPGLQDEPQHELMGQITEQMLELMKIKWAYLSDDLDEAKQQLAEADRHISNNQSFFFVVRKGTFSEVELKPNADRNKIQPNIERSAEALERPTRKAALTTLLRQADNQTALLATTGKTGRELFEVEDLPNSLYMVGSMGCISSLGLGLALTQPQRNVIAIDGDGALIMRMGSMATNAHYQPSNLLHVLLDNQSHDSTGGQATVSPNIEFTDQAAAVGYSTVRKLSTLVELDQSISAWKADKQLTFLHFPIAKGSSENLGRPNVKPHEVKERLMAFLAE